MLKGFCRWLLYNKLGWSRDITVAFPQKCIVCLAPHTSNWDFILGQLFSLAEGIKLAEQIIASGEATKVLEKFIEVSNR